MMRNPFEPRFKDWLSADEGTDAERWEDRLKIAEREILEREIKILEREILMEAADKSKVDDQGLLRKIEVYLRKTVPQPFVGNIALLARGVFVVLKGCVTLVKVQPGGHPVFSVATHQPEIVLFGLGLIAIGIMSDIDLWLTWKEQAKRVELAKREPASLSQEELWLVEGLPTPRKALFMMIDRLIVIAVVLPLIGLPKSAGSLGMQILLWAWFRFTTPSLVLLGLSGEGKVKKYLSPRNVSYWNGAVLSWLTQLTWVFSGNGPSFIATVLASVAQMVHAVDSSRPKK